MSGLRLVLRAAPADRVDLRSVCPAVVAGKTAREIAALPLGAAVNAPVLGDLFDVLAATRDALVIEAGSDRLDFVGAGLISGTRLIIDGDVGAHAGSGLAGGHLDIRGTVGAHLGSSMRSGLISITGSAGDNLGGPAPAKRDGLKGGIIHVGGDIGGYCGERMRAGTVIARGRIGDQAAPRMMGGTIFAQSGFGSGPGALLRRGTLIAPSAARLLPTFVDCGRHRLLILDMMGRYLQGALGDLAPPAICTPVHRFMGDTASIGRGELLLTT
ncbi:MAG: formylmethanofuran dehydrogenase subunit C [Hyphomicrobiaceae bacterium]|nr:formylmethanofuran dehydrogenase subunit C [Hyphomicrobiaceae bacterium]